MNTSGLRPALAIAVLALNACSGPTTEILTPKTETEKVAAAPAEPVTAKTAFYAMYKSAYAWAPDILPLTIEPKSKTVEGKAAVWEATFGSPTKREYSRFTYAIEAKPPDVSKGVSAAHAIPWAGPTRNALAFQSSELAVDSDAAYKTALGKASSWVKEHPGVPLNTFSLGAASNFPGPVWSFVWGDKKMGFFQLVSATTGQALK